MPGHGTAPNGYPAGMTNERPTPSDDPRERAFGASVSAAPAEHSADSATPTSPRWDSTKVLIVGLVSAVALLVGGIGGYVIGMGAAPRTAGQDAAQSSTGPTPSASATTTGAGAPSYAPSLTDASALAIVRGEPTRVANDARAVGRADAPVVMVDFSDYSCPMCARFAQDTEAGLQDLIDAGTLRIEYRDFVIFQDYGSDIAAAGAHAAANQGKFIEYHRAAFAAAETDGHTRYTADSVVALARTAGVSDLDRFRTDLTSGATTRAVSSETTHAQQIGITGTPFFMVNDTAFSGAQPLAFVRATIENQSKVAPYTAR